MVAQLARFPMAVQLPELDVEALAPLHPEKLYFESHPHNPGFEDVNGKPAAHHLIDYIKVWDVPTSVQIPNYPQ